MKRTAIFAHLIFTTILSGCAALTQSATPQDAERVRAAAARYEAKGVKNLGATSSNRIALRPGQWVAMLSQTKSDPNDITLQVMKVASVSGDTVTIETEQYGAANQGKRLVMQQRIRNFPVSGQLAYTSDEAAGVIGGIEVVSMRMMDEEGKVVEMPQLPFQIGRLGSDFVKNNVATGEIRKEQCGNEYYRASSCYVVPFETKVLWMTESGTTYAHSAVPVLGFINSEGDSSRVDVIGFGTSGAQILLR
ncbi:MAG: hypothetical protein J5J00_14305 [Deltaproteobacteria bacterium]|nr:hypothetical protein [Deltaproteobacteria bacterium]